MRVVITTRFDIEVEDRHSMESVGLRIIEKLDEVGSAYTGVALVYDYPGYPIAGIGITIDQQWELVQDGRDSQTRRFSEHSPFHPEALSLLVALGEVTR